MKHLNYAAVAVVALVLSAGAFACEGMHSAAANSSIVVAQQQMDNGMAAQGTEASSNDSGAATDESKPKQQ